MIELNRELLEGLRRSTNELTRSRLALSLGEAVVKPPKVVNRRATGDRARANRVGYAAMRAGGLQFAQGASKRGGNLQVGGGYSFNPWVDRILTHGGREGGAPTIGNAIQRAEGSLLSTLSVRPPEPHRWQ